MKARISAVGAQGFSCKLHWKTSITTHVRRSGDGTRTHGGPIRSDPRRSVVSQLILPRMEESVAHHFPRSPTLSITTARRSAALRQFVCTANCAASTLPERIARTIAPCSATDVVISRVSMLTYSRS